MFPNSANTKITLFSVVSVVDKIGVKHQEVTNRKEVMGTLLSITSGEYVSSVSLSIAYEFKVKIYFKSYDNQKYAKINGKIYKVERTYITGMFIELYLTQVDGEFGDAL